MVILTQINFTVKAADALTYKLKTERWEILSHQTPLLARAGAQVAMRKHTLYYIGGELKPGLRSPGIVQLDLR